MVCVLVWSDLLTVYCMWYNFFPSSLTNLASKTIGVKAGKQDSKDRFELLVLCVLLSLLIYTGFGRIGVLKTKNTSYID